MIHTSGGRPPGPPDPPFHAVIDDQGARYQLRHDSSGSSDSAGKRQRWDLRALIEPTPNTDVRWLEVETDHGAVRAALEPPVPAMVSKAPLDPAPTLAEIFLRSQLYKQAWLHLLDPERPLDRLDPAVDALVAVGAVRRDDQIVRAVTAVDDALGGAEPADEVPPILASALTTGARTKPWRGVAALGIALDNLDGVTVALEALVGHQDRTALHFYSPPDAGFMGSAFTHKLVVYATDDIGGGYVASDESLFGSEHGAYHFRPALNGEASRFDVTLESLATRVTVSIGLSPPRGVSPTA